MERILCLFLTGSLKLFCTDLGPFGAAEEIGYPFGWRWVRLLGSCHHRLCISDRDGRRLAMWNPASGTHRLLPPADAEIARLSVYGFGYNIWNKEFVLLRVVHTLEEPIVSAISIYRSRANVWMPLEVTLRYYLDDPDRMGIFVGGRLHWIMRRQLSWKSAKVLMAFDIYTERFVELGLPNSIDNRLPLDLAVLEECLCLIIYGEQMGVDVWIMREYGVNGPWDLLFSIPNHPENRRPVRPLAYSQNDDGVFMEVCYDTLAWYDLQTGHVRESHINGVRRLFHAATCL